MLDISEGVLLFARDHPRPVQLRGRVIDNRSENLQRLRWPALYVVLSLPTFRLVRSRSLSLGARVPKILARRISTRSGRLGGAAAAGRGGAVADFFFVIFGSSRWR